MHLGPSVLFIMLPWQFKDSARISRLAGSGRHAVMAETTGKMGEISCFINFTGFVSVSVCKYVQVRNRVNVSFQLLERMSELWFISQSTFIISLTCLENSIPLQEPLKRQNLEDLLHKLTNYKSENSILSQQPGDTENQEKNRRGLDNLRIQQRRFGCRMFFWKSWTYCWCPSLVFKLSCILHREDILLIHGLIH